MIPAALYGVFDGTVSASVNGFINGAVIGLVAVGLVLVYKGARVFNFAQGEFGTVAAFVAWLLFTYGGHHPLWLALLWGVVAGALLVGILAGTVSMRGATIAGLGGAALMTWLLQAGAQPLWISIPVGLGAGTVFGLAVERLVVRPLRDKARVIVLVATAGIAIGTISLQLFLGEAEVRVLAPIYQLRDAAGDPSAYFFLGAAISAQQLIILGILAVSALALWLFFSRTNLGLAVLGTSQDTLATRLSGISVNRVSAFVWGLAAFMGSVAGVLYAGQVFLAPGLVTSSLLIPAFTGAVLGGMTSLPGAFLGGLLVGVARDVGAQIIPESITGGAELTVFALLLLVLLVRPQGLLGSET